MKSTVVLKLGTTLPHLPRELGDFENWIVRRLRLPADQATVIDAAGGARLPDPKGWQASF